MTQINPVNKSFCLQMLCESNYQRLLELLPPLDAQFACVQVRRHGKVRMQVRELARTPYTLTLQLNPVDGSRQPVEPEFRVQIYLDTRAVEVLDVGNPLNQDRPAPDACPYERMQQKWVLNYFLEKWLSYLLRPAAQDQTRLTPALSES